MDVHHIRSLAICQQDMITWSWRMVIKQNHSMRSPMDRISHNPKSDRDRLIEDTLGRYCLKVFGSPFCDSAHITFCPYTLGTVFLVGASDAILDHPVLCSSLSLILTSVNLMMFSHEVWNVVSLAAPIYIGYNAEEEGWRVDSMLLKWLEIRPNSASSLPYSVMPSVFTYIWTAKLQIHQKTFVVNPPNFVPVYISHYMLLQTTIVMILCACV